MASFLTGLDVVRNRGSGLSGSPVTACQPEEEKQMKATADCKTFTEL